MKKIISSIIIVAMILTMQLPAIYDVKGESISYAENLDQSKIFDIIAAQNQTIRIQIVELLVDNLSAFGFKITTSNSEETATSIFNLLNLPVDSSVTVNTIKNGLDELVNMNLKNPQIVSDFMEILTEKLENVDIPEELEGSDLLNQINQECGSYRIFMNVLLLLKKNVDNYKVILDLMNYDSKILLLNNGNIELSPLMNEGLVTIVDTLLGNSAKEKFISNRTRLVSLIDKVNKLPMGNSKIAFMNDLKQHNILTDSISPTPTQAPSVPSSSVVVLPTAIPTPTKILVEEPFERIPGAVVDPTKQTEKLQDNLDNIAKAENIGTAVNALENALADNTNKQDVEKNQEVIQKAVEIIDGLIGDSKDIIKSVENIDQVISKLDQSKIQKSNIEEIKAKIVEKSVDSLLKDTVKSNNVGDSLKAVADIITSLENTNSNNKEQFKEIIQEKTAGALVLNIDKTKKTEDVVKNTQELIGQVNVSQIKDMKTIKEKVIEKSAESLTTLVSAEKDMTKAFEKAELVIKSISQEDLKTKDKISTEDNTKLQKYTVEKTADALCNIVIESKTTEAVAKNTSNVLDKIIDSKIINNEEKEIYIDKITTSATKKVIDNIQNAETAKAGLDILKTAVNSLASEKIMTQNSDRIEVLLAQIAEKAVQKNSEQKLDSIKTLSDGTINVSITLDKEKELKQMVADVLSNQKEAQTILESKGLSKDTINSIESKITFKADVESQMVATQIQLSNNFIQEANKLDKVDFNIGNTIISIPPVVMENNNNESVSVSVQSIDKKDDRLKNIDLTQIGDSKIYDFTIKSGENVISNFCENIVKVSLPYTPKKNEANVDKITVFYINDAGKLINQAATYKDGLVTFDTNHFSKYVAKYVDVEFIDMAGYDWAKESVSVMTAKGIITGMGYNKFLPSDNLTRAQLVTMIVNAFKLNDDTASNVFKDVANDVWYSKFIASAYKAGIVKGKTSVTFEPDAFVTRQEMAVMVSNTLKIVKNKADNQKNSKVFKDANQIGDYAKSSIDMVTRFGIVKGYAGDIFEPKKNTTRAEAAVVIYGLYMIK